MPEFVKHVPRRKCTKDLYLQFYLLVFRPIEEIIFLSKGKGLWLLLSILDKKMYVLSGPRLLREVLG